MHDRVLSVLCKTAIRMAAVTALRRLQSLGDASSVCSCLCGHEYSHGGQERKKRQTDGLQSDAKCTAG